MTGRASTAAHVRCAAIAAVMAAGMCSWGGGARAADLVIPAGREAELATLVAPYRLGEEVGDGFRLNGIQIAPRRIDLILERKDEPAERVTLALVIRSTAGSLLGARAPYGVAVDPAEDRQSPAARRAVAKLKEVVAHNADGAFWDRVLSAPPVEAHRALPQIAPPRPRGAFILIGVLVFALAAMALRFRTAAPVLVAAWRFWAAPIVVGVAAVAVPLVPWILTRSTFGGLSDLEAFHHRQALQREWVRWSLWIAFGAGGTALIVTLVRVASRRTRERLSAASAVSLDALAVLAWSAFVRFVLTQPNILTDGGSGYGRLWRMWVGGWQGFSVLIETFYPTDPRFMWTIIRVPWVLAALAPPLLLLLARGLGFGRGAALFAGVALASLPLHAAMYSSDFEFGPLLSFNLLGLAFLAAAVRFERAELAAAGGAVLAYTCWGRPDAPIVGAGLLAIALPALRRWRTRPVLLAALGWFAVNAAASFASARALGAGSHIAPHLWPGFPVLRFLGMQEVVPFWLLLPLPFGVAHLLRRDPGRLAVIAVGIAAGLVPLSFSPVGNGDPTHSYMEYFRYGTWALPWIVLMAATGMDAGVQFVTRRFARVGRLELVGRAMIIVVCMATPLFFRGYLARQYGPRVEEEAFREALRHVPEDCGLVVPDDDSDDQGGGTIEIMRRYVYIAEEAAAQDKSRVNPERVTGVTAFLRSAGDHRIGPPLPSAATPEGNREEPVCWYYFRGSYCYTGLQGHGSAVCAELERDAVLEPVLTQRILYISHRLVTRPDMSDRPLYDPDQSLVLSKIVGWRTDAADAASLR